MEHAVQTIKKTIYTPSGTASWSPTVVIDANGENAIKVVGKIQAWADSNTITPGTENSSILAGKDNRIVLGNNSTILWWDTNTINGNISTIGGGTRNSIVGRISSILAGGNNNIQWDVSTIVAGGNNSIHWNVSSIVAGFNNKVIGDNSSILGGSGNQITNGDTTTILGGYRNSINGIQSTIGWWKTNQISGAVSSIIGGKLNTIDGLFSNIGGGQNNSIIGNNSSILGGLLNTLTGDESVIIGWDTNRLSWSYASIIWGQENTVNADYALAGGKYAQALHDGSFIWSDSFDRWLLGSRNFQSTAPYQFLIRAYNGVGINTNSTELGNLNIKGVGNAGGLALYQWWAGNTSARMYLSTNDNLHLTRWGSDVNGLIIKPNGVVWVWDNGPNDALRLDVSWKVWANAYCDGAGNNCSTPAQIHNAVAGISMRSCYFTSYHAWTTLAAGRIFIKDPRGTIASNISGYGTTNNNDQIKVSSNSCYDHGTTTKPTQCFLMVQRKGDDSNSSVACRIGEGSNGRFLDNLSSDNGDLCTAKCIRLE